MACNWRWVGEEELWGASKNIMGFMIAVLGLRRVGLRDVT